MGEGLFFCLIILIQMVHVLLLSQDSDGHLSKREEGPTRSLLGYHLQSTAPLEVGGPDQGGQEWCPTVWRTTMDSPKMTATW